MAFGNTVAKWLPSPAGMRASPSVATHVVMNSEEFQWWSFEPAVCTTHKFNYICEFNAEFAYALDMKYTESKYA